MKKTDIGVVAFMYAVCALFLGMALQLKKAARIYPIFVIVLLFLLTTGYVIKMLLDAKHHGVTSGLEEIFEGFQAKQFFVILAMLIGYLVLMYLAGFYISTILLMFSSLLFLRVKKLYILFATGAIVALVYCAFTLFLKVNLPTGLFFS